MTAAAGGTHRKRPSLRVGVRVRAAGVQLWRARLRGVECGAGGAGRGRRGTCVSRTFLEASNTGSLAGRAPGATRNGCCAGSSRECAAHGGQYRAEQDAQARDVRVVVVVLVALRAGCQRPCATFATTATTASTYHGVGVSGKEGEWWCGVRGWGTSALEAITSCWVYIGAGLRTLQPPVFHGHLRLSKSNSCSISTPDQRGPGTSRNSFQ